MEGRFGRDAEWSHDRAMWKPNEKKVEWILRADTNKSREGEALTLRITASTDRCGTVRREISL